MELHAEYNRHLIAYTRLEMKIRNFDPDHFDPEHGRRSSEEPLRYPQSIHEEIPAFMNGKHPFLRTPINERELSSIKITERVLPGDGMIRIIHLNQPRNMNALGREIVSELRGEIDKIHAEETVQDNKTVGKVRALIIASETPKSFSTGADLKERKAMTQLETNLFLTQLRETFTRLSELPIPTIAAVHGFALGGGLELALSTTLRVVHAEAILGAPEVRIGIIPGAGGTYRLPAVVGRSKALELMLTGRRVSGTDAVEMGLGDVLASGEFQGAAGRREKTLEVALGLAASIGIRAPLAVRAVLRAVSKGGTEGEQEAYESVVGTRDRDEALLAFEKRRMPVFTGS